ncbi:hypothetical protein [Hahella sp. HN01]|uniref:hypothetical protein n=1 Tax=Hahella sp. HN01 TaxID=2847262 RepID=UPI001C1ED166|nr:hypothetical protein [Hahella sp. HN01]MBU6949909.1 hypothetical protein [Hahella sp. HN01]
MYINDARNRPSPPSSASLKQAAQVESTPAQAPLTEGELHDRRMRPDRRRSDENDYDGQERRKRRERRTPKLLGARDGQPEELENRTGRLVNTAV